MESQSVPRRIEVVGTGFTVLDRVYAGAEHHEALGGSCGNVLVSLAMLNRHVAPVLSLGLDDVGTRLVEEFAQAGAETLFIHQRMDVGSPVLAQHLDGMGHHWFSFTCPDTQASYPRYRPIDQSDLDRAWTVVSDCAVFYADRVSDAIVDAMKVARDTGALIYFEPSDVEDAELFSQAVALASILKFSSDRLDNIAALDIGEDAILIVTHGAAGLEVRHGADRHWCASVEAPLVRDTCGSGDMVSVGIINWLLDIDIGSGTHIDLSAILPGVVAGQRLAAENCAFEGARGVFRQRGPDFARSLLRNEAR